MGHGDAGTARGVLESLLAISDYTAGGQLYRLHASRGSVTSRGSWIPACAGMTKGVAGELRGRWRRTSHGHRRCRDGGFGLCFGGGGGHSDSGRSRGLGDTFWNRYEVEGVTWGNDLGGW
jgi:hypothetical protein